MILHVLHGAMHALAEPCLQPSGIFVKHLCFGNAAIIKSWSGSNIFNDLKLRVSYGVTGNEQIGDYRYSTYYRYSIAGASYQFGNEYVPTLRPTGVDPNIKWEETVSTNIGIDAGFLTGRLTASIDYYIKNVNDLLFEIAVPAGSNLSDRVLTNIGRVKNEGIELVIDAVAIDKGDFKWQLGFNASYNKNKIVLVIFCLFFHCFSGIV